VGPGTKGIKNSGVPEDVKMAFVESEHPRGQPDNAGEFAKKPVVSLMRKRVRVENPLPRVKPELENEMEQALAKFAEPDTIREFVKYSQSEEKVVLSQLSSPQTVNDPEAVKYFKENPDALEETEPLPLVIQYGKHMILRDGNSRVTAAMETGRKHIKARVVYVPESQKN